MYIGAIMGRPTGSELTFQEKYFVDLFVFDPDCRHIGTECALRAYHCKDRQSASAVASGVLRREEIQLEIDRMEQLRPENLTEHAIRRKIAENAFFSKSDTARGRSMDLLAKVSGLIVDKSQVTIEANIQSLNVAIGAEDAKALVSTLRERMLLSSQGKLTSLPPTPRATKEEKQEPGQEKGEE